MPFSPITSEPQKRLYLLVPADPRVAVVEDAASGGSRPGRRGRAGSRGSPCSATTLSTTRRLIRRKSPVFGGISTSAMRLITR